MLSTSFVEMTTSVAALGDFRLVEVVGDEWCIPVSRSGWHPAELKTQPMKIDDDTLMRLYGRKRNILMPYDADVDGDDWLLYCYVDERNPIIGLMAKMAREQHKNERVNGVIGCIKRVGRRFHGAYFVLDQDLVRILLDSPVNHTYWFCHYWWGPLWPIVEVRVPKPWLIRLLTRLVKKGWWGRWWGRWGGRRGSRRRRLSDGRGRSDGCR